MPDEIKFSQEQWDEMLAKQIAKQTVKPTRATVAASKPYHEKSFVSMHYNAAGVSDSDTTYNSRDPKTYVVLHFYMRPGDTFQALQNDARNYQASFNDCKLIVHSHA
jgi:hypothetical protein